MILNSLKIPNNDINDIINSNSDTTLCTESNKLGYMRRWAHFVDLSSLPQRNGSRYLEPCLPLVH